MEIAVENKNEATLLKVSGRMDAVTSSDFEKKVNELAAEKKVKIAVNLEKLEYISSAGLRSILASTKKLRALGGDLAFSGVKGHVLEVFNISGLKTVFPIFDTEEQALKSFSK